MRKGFAPLPPSVKCLVGLFPFSSGTENPPEAATLVSRDDMRKGGANFACLEPRPVAMGMRRVAMACPLGCLLEPTAGPRGDVGENATAPDSTSASIAASIAPARIEQQSRVWDIQSADVRGHGQRVGEHVQCQPTCSVVTGRVHRCPVARSESFGARARQGHLRTRGVKGGGNGGEQVVRVRRARVY